MRVPVLASCALGALALHVVPRTSRADEVVVPVTFDIASWTSRQFHDDPVNVFVYQGIHIDCSFEPFDYDPAVHDGVRFELSGADGAAIVLNAAGRTLDFGVQSGIEGSCEPGVGSEAPDILYPDVEPPFGWYGAVTVPPGGSWGMDLTRPSLRSFYALVSLQETSNTSATFRGAWISTSPENPIVAGRYENCHCHVSLDRDVGPYGVGFWFTHVSRLATTSPSTEAECAFGGTTYRHGLDDGLPGGIAGDDVLQVEEIEDAVVLCNPAPGDSVLVAITDEPAGATCTHGGRRLAAGLDDGDGGATASDGVLATTEEDEVRFVCDEAPSPPPLPPPPPVSAVRTIDEAPTDTCPHGATRVDYGLDDGTGGGTAGNGVLEDGEVDHSSSVCAPEPAASGGCSLTTAHGPAKSVSNVFAAMLVVLAARLARRRSR